ncbi:substrate-binding domain-containing protein [Streptomyces sp. H27-C3]|uniref:substrate-binding domain-containing protein n=1 Tax=Streptomyces sp. H27-C3 TaxID=3046305 RepID=UPI0024BA7A9B|nr:substrate-binding domain-containing protein [Streptomyces sp. H27-C3]MDJ0463826.1 substrate-binding domain-containing protein [Streptomyces sp. H27-C3]
MNGFPWESAIAMLGLAIPLAAAAWEFAFAGRKRLGYRIQMDTTAPDAAEALHAGVLRQMQRDNASLRDPSFVLLRIENSGWTLIDSGDYVSQGSEHAGIEVRFPGRRVVGMVATEMSHDYLRRSFVSTHREGAPAGAAPGLEVVDGRITLPKVTLNRGNHYKVLAVLERERDFAGEEFPDPQVVAGIKGGVHGGSIRKTASHVLASKPVMTFIAMLVLVVAAQSLTTFTRDDVRAAPLDCAQGTLALSGSTAFAPVVREAAKQYEKTCPDARIPITENTFKGSVAGLDTLAAADKETKGGNAGSPDRLAFTDGKKSIRRPQLLPRPVALALFTLVVSKDTGVQDLDKSQVRQIYAGRVTNWRQVGGNDIPIQLISRNPGSGTRSTLVQQVLGGKELMEVTQGDCAALDTGRPGRCEVGDTGTLLDTVSATPGALGHSEIGATNNRDDLQQVRIDGYAATLEGVDGGAYPYWQTEFAYTYGEPPADSIAAGFLRYLANEVGKDVLRSQGHRPCAELAKPLLCRPT